MSAVALISWIVTAQAGATLFSIWLARGGLRGQGADASRFPQALIFVHPILAATSLIIWIIYLASDTDSLRWVAFAILLVVAAALGFTMARLWRRNCSSRTTTVSPPPRKPTPATLPGALVGLGVQGLGIGCLGTAHRGRP